MTTFAELEALVLAQTRRPEIPAVTAAAIRAAVLRAHHVDNFPRDLAAGLLNYTIAEAYFYDFPSVQTLLPRLRSGDAGVIERRDMRVVMNGRTVSSHAS